MDALLALRRSDPARAAARRRRVAVCRAHGMGHIGPWAFGVRALVEPDPAARVGFLEEGERQLALGCVSHNHLELRQLAIDGLLEIGDWDGVDANCARILAYTATQTLPLSEFVIARGTALAQFGRGDRSDALRQTLLRLQATAAQSDLNSTLPALAVALGSF